MEDNKIHTDTETLTPVEETKQDAPAKLTAVEETKQDAPAKLTAKENIIQLLKFVLFMAGAGLIQIASFTLLNEVIIPGRSWTYWTAYLISVTLSVVFSFTLNRKFTFKSVSNIPKAMLLVLIFYAAFIPLTTWETKVLTDAMNFNGKEYLVLFINMVENLILEFLWYRFVVYRNTINTSVKVKDTPHK